MKKKIHPNYHKIKVLMRMKKKINYIRMQLN